MLQFSISDTSTIVILTLTEKVSLPSPFYYLFVFTHVTTKEQVKFVRGVPDDQSAYQGRYNQFTLNPSVIFSAAHTGQWHYKVYEQASAINTDPDQAGAVLEEGKLLLVPSVAFEYTTYHSPTTYTAYNG